MAAAKNYEIQGFARDGYEPVRQCLEQNFRSRGELGASVCVWHRGEKVVDLWGGFLNKEKSETWQEDTLCTIFSATKGMVALCFAMLEERGKFSYEDKIAHYWPEFAAAGKEDVSVRTLLNHRAGLVAIDEPLSLDDLEADSEKVANCAAAQATFWKPGEDQGYHGVTYGIYAAELFRRIAGESVGVFLQREVCKPLGAELYLGLPSEEEKRVSPIFPVGPWELLTKMVPKMLFHRGTEGRVYRQVLMGKESAKAFGNPAELGPKGINNFNTARVHAMELPWGNGVGNARGLARIYAALANGGEIDGVRLLRPESIAPIQERQSWTEMDRVLRKPIGWSQGFVKEERGMFSPNDESFGHPGAGGALGWCDPKENLAISYIPNRMAHHVRSPRARALAASVYSCMD